MATLYLSRHAIIWNYPKGYAPHVTSVIIHGCLAEVIPSASPPSVSSMEPETVAQLFCSTSDMYTLGAGWKRRRTVQAITGKWQPYAFSSGMPFMWYYPKGYSPHVTSAIIRGCLAEVIPSASPPSVSSMEPDTGKQQLYAFSSGVYVRQLYGVRDGSTILLIHKRRLCTPQPGVRSSQYHPLSVDCRQVTVLCMDRVSKPNSCFQLLQTNRQCLGP